jgi:hypothetical protein
LQKWQVSDDCGLVDVMGRANGVVV